MNAQEAIEQIEWLIEQHKQMQMYFADKRDDKQVRRYESLQNEIEALSIVLESARLLHEHLGYSDKEYEEEKEYFTMDVESVRFDDPLCLTKTDAEKIGYELDSDYDWKELGIEEGADE